MVVYSWCRLLDLRHGCALRLPALYIQNAQAVNAASVPPEKLAVHAMDEFTLQVNLRAPKASFIRLLACATFFPVPRQPWKRHGARGGKIADPAWLDRKVPLRSALPQAAGTVVKL